MPDTKIPTADYLPLFSSWRKSHFNIADSSWTETGKDFLRTVNAEIKKMGNVPYPDTRDGFDKLRAKHNTTRSKFKSDLIKPIDAAFSVVEYTSHGVGKKKTPNLSHLNTEQRLAYNDKRMEVDKYLSTHFPGLPSYEEATRGGLSIDQMKALLA